MTDHLGPSRIEHHIATEFEQMRLLLHQDGGESALQEMPHPLMPAIDGLGIRAVELPHAAGEIGLRGFEQQMIVVIHQAVRMAAPPEAIDDMGQSLQKQGTVPIIRDDGLAGVAATGDMAHGTRIFHAQRSSHEEHSTKIIVRLTGLTPFWF